jgi:hypothetical protein
MMKYNNIEKLLFSEEDFYDAELTKFFIWIFRNLKIPICLSSED